MQCAPSSVMVCAVWYFILSILSYQEGTCTVYLPKKNKATQTTVKQKQKASSNSLTAPKDQSIIVCTAKTFLSQTCSSFLSLQVPLAKGQRSGLPAADLRGLRCVRLWRLTCLPRPTNNCPALSLVSLTSTPSYTSHTSLSPFLPQGQIIVCSNRADRYRLSINWTTDSLRKSKVSEIPEITLRH